MMTHSENKCSKLCLGMGVPTVTAARILKGQLSGDYGEEGQLEMDKFPYVALSKVQHHTSLTHHCFPLCS